MFMFWQVSLRQRESGPILIMIGWRIHADMPNNASFATGGSVRKHQ